MLPAGRPIQNKASDRYRNIQVCISMILKANVLYGKKKSNISCRAVHVKARCLPPARTVELIPAPPAKNQLLPVTLDQWKIRSPLSSPADENVPSGGCDRGAVQSSVRKAPRSVGLRRLPVPKVKAKRQGAIQ